MSRTTPPRAGAARGPLALLALAGLGPLLATGCQSLSLGNAPTSRPPAGPAAAAQKTDFHPEVTALQQFNVHVELGRALESQGNFEGAVAEYQKAADVCARKGSLSGGAEVGPVQQSLAQRRMAAAYDRLGRFAQAEAHYTEAMKLTPGDPRVWNDVGYSYYLQSRWADAERALKTADTMEPNNPRVLTNLGLTLGAQGREEEALALLSRANGPANGHANLGYLLAAMGRTAEARRHYEQALALQPQLASARDALTRLDTQAARTPASLASAAAPADPKVGVASATTHDPKSK